MKSFIVEFWYRIFNSLRYLSPFEMIRSRIHKTQSNYGFVDSWVLGHLFLAIILLIISSNPKIAWWEWIILFYAGFRVFEIIIYQINVLLFDEYRAKKNNKPYALRGYRRVVILLLHNYIEMLFWFAIFYRNFDYLFESANIPLNTIVGSLYFSLVTMSTLGYGDITPIGTAGMVIIIIQTIIGLLMVLLIIARFISLLPEPKTQDVFEKKSKEQE